MSNTLIWAVFGLLVVSILFVVFTTTRMQKDIERQQEEQTSVIKTINDVVGVLSKQQKENENG